VRAHAAHRCQFGSLPLVIGTETEEGQHRARDCLLRSRGFMPKFSRHRIDLSYQPELADPDTILWAAEVVYRLWRIPIPPSRALSAAASPDTSGVQSDALRMAAWSGMHPGPSPVTLALPTSPNNPGVPARSVVAPTPPEAGQSPLAPAAVTAARDTDTTAAADFTSSQASLSSGSESNEPDGALADKLELRTGASGVQAESDRMLDTARAALESSV
jgi:hypothetical protein